MTTNAVSLKDVSLIFGGQDTEHVLAVDTINLEIPKANSWQSWGQAGVEEQRY